MSSFLPTQHLLPAATEATVTSLPVTGTIPDYLDGRYVRIGPNPLPGQYERDNYSIFGLAGDGMVHGVRLRDGRAEWYRNRWVRTPRVSRLLGERPVPLSGRGGGLGFIAPNTNVISHAGKTLALIEGGVACPYELTEELETVGACDFAGSFRGGFTGHPKLDPATGELHAITYNFAGTRSVRYLVIDARGQLRRSEHIDIGGRPALHDIALSQNYVVIFDTPLVADPDALLARLLPGRTPAAARLALSMLLDRIDPPSALLNPLLDRLPRPKTGEYPFRWDTDHPARIGLIPRQGPARVRWFDIDPCYVFHTLNAYEHDGHLLCDAVRLDGPTRPGDYDVDQVFETGKPRLTRWRVNLATGAVAESPLGHHIQDFPMIDQRRTATKHTVGFTVALEPRATTSDDRDDVGGTVLRYDLDAAQISEYALPAHQLPGEFSVIPTGPNAPEADGVLMGFVYDRTTGHSNLLLLDATTLTKIAEVHLPTRVPFLFHGNWLPTA